ncbi:hypothetical protein PybrP1_010912 [[Pythium] brassicae (nom. inval.)]|nr:hypothetical protein PybrP1_010912 [[Pythium] brassicae (nom. inval.)]
MPTSPDVRAAKRAALSSVPALGKSASESALRKKQLGSLLEQELLVLERDEGKRHARELSVCLLDYAKKIEELQEKNRRLEQELSFDDNVARNDPFFNDQVAEKLSNLYLQGNNVMIRLELEKKEIARLNALIQRHESTLAQQKTKLYELAALDQNHAALIGRVRKLENDIDRRIVRMNEKLNTNRKLREAIDAHRAERARMDAIYAKMSSEMLAKRAKVARASGDVERLRQEVTDVEKQIDDIRRDGEEWEAACDQKAAGLLQELKEIALHQRDGEELVDEEKHKYLGENDIVRNMVAAQESALRSRATRSRWKTGQAKIATDVLLTKYQENRTIIEKIHEVEHFDRIQHVNQLAEDIENYRQVSAKLREEIGKLKQRKDSFTIDQKKLKEEANHNLQEFLAVLKPSILLLHSRIGCPEVHNDNDMKKILGEVEEQVVTVLQNFHLKSEAQLKEEAAKDAARPGSSAPSSSRKPREAMKSRPGTPVSAPAPTEHASLPGGLSPELETNQASASAGTGGATASGQRTATEPQQLSPTVKAVSAFVARDQPYRYAGLRPPHLSMEELKKKDNVEEEYPLTYDELKSKVWHTDAAQ